MSAQPQKERLAFKLVDRGRVLSGSFLPWEFFNKAIPFELWVNDFFQEIVSC